MIHFPNSIQYSDLHGYTIGIEKYKYCFCYFHSVTGFIFIIRWILTEILKKDFIQHGVVVIFSKHTNAIHRKIIFKIIREDF